MDADASLTANTKEAMNLVQEMWGSPSPVQGLFVSINFSITSIYLYETGFFKVSL